MDGLEDSVRPMSAPVIRRAGMQTDVAASVGCYLTLTIILLPLPVCSAIL